MDSRQLEENYIKIKEDVMQWTGRSTNLKKWPSHQEESIFHISYCLLFADKTNTQNKYVLLQYGGSLSASRSKLCGLTESSLFHMQSKPQ